MKKKNKHIGSSFDDWLLSDRIEDIQGMFRKLREQRDDAWERLHAIQSCFDGVGDSTFNRLRARVFKILADTWTQPTPEEIDRAHAEGKRLADYINKESRRVSSEEERLSYKEDVACSSRAPGTSLSEAITKAEARNPAPPTRPVEFSGCNTSAQQSSPLNGDEGERCEPNSPPKLK